MKCIQLQQLALETTRFEVEGERYNIAQEVNRVIEGV